ncbi:hypothetical protein BDR26DRAFT_918343 [Obelidium mucronatum]|nr:hypothetical protein BDR26DRAFT_918343 [Obelidium mucronatum]
MNNHGHPVEFPHADFTPHPLPSHHHQYESIPYGYEQPQPQQQLTHHPYDSHTIHNQVPPQQHDDQLLESFFYEQQQHVEYRQPHFGSHQLQSQTQHITPYPIDPLAEMNPRKRLTTTKSLTNKSADNTESPRQGGTSGINGSKDSERLDSFTDKKSHKDIEKKRREAISNGISDLAEIVPGALGQKKGKVVEKAIEYLSMLKASEVQSVEKWKIEKGMLDDQIKRLSQQAEELRRTNDSLRRELAEYK